MSFVSLRNYSRFRRDESGTQSSLGKLVLPMFHKENRSVGLAERNAKYSEKIEVNLPKSFVH